MKDQVVLVDFENVQKLDLARLPAHAHIRIFVGAQQARLPTALVLQAQALGLAIEWIRIEADFILANPPFNISGRDDEQLADDERWRCGAPWAGNANVALVKHARWA